ncbi:MAG: tRNA-dihydrouridine synthase [Christensenellales bacterium]
MRKSDDGLSCAAGGRDGRGFPPGAPRLLFGRGQILHPVVSPTQNLAFTARDLSILAPENGFGVPQLLCKDAALFLWAAQALGDMGYGEVNLNLGCPSGTVTAKGKGSGLLADVPALERLLDGFARSPPRLHQDAHRLHPAG